MSSTLWGSNGSTVYSIGGDRDVLLIAPNLLPHHNFEAVVRRPGELTEEDRQKLLNQGVSPELDDQDEVAIVKARYQLDRKCKRVEVKSGHVSRNEVMKSINHILTTTKSHGGKISNYIEQV